MILILKMLSFELKYNVDQLMGIQINSNETPIFYFNTNNISLFKNELFSSYFNLLNTIYIGVIPCQITLSLPPHHLRFFFKKSINYYK